MILRKPDEPDLLGEEHLPTILDEQRTRAHREIKDLSPESVRADDAEAAVRQIVARWRWEPIAVGDVDVIAAPGHFNVVELGVQRRIEGTTLEVHIPWSGSPGVFAGFPSSRSSDTPTGRLVNHEIVLRIQAYGDDPGDDLNAFIKQEVERIRWWIGALNADVEKHNAELERLATEWLEQRRAHVAAHDARVATLRFPLRVREGMPPTFPIRLKRAELAPVVSTTAPQGPPVPTVASADYEQILVVLENMSVVMETHPDAFQEIEEELLRDMFLVFLNGLYVGAAKGEAFNRKGKTDILVTHEGITIFVAECKFWHGQKQLVAALEQLFEYLTVRETKAAILLFARDVERSVVLERAPTAIRGHASFRREVQVTPDAWSRFILQHPRDPAVELMLTTMVFDVPGKLPSNGSGDE